MTGFARLLRAEWTKLRSVRAWILGLAAVAAAILAFGLTPSRQGSCGQNGPGSECTPLLGPQGQEVTDSFTLVYRTLDGDGSVTARVADFTGWVEGGAPGTRRELLVPWAKAGLIIKAGTGQGAAYAAVMLTGGHGVRLQYDYDHDEGRDAGAKIKAQPVYLRLTRAGDVVKAEQSGDGATWATVGSARLPGLPASVTAGLFVTSPPHDEQVNEAIVLSGIQGGPSRATASFDHLGTAGAWSGQWQGTVIGAPSGPAAHPGDLEAEAAGAGWRLTGSGDIAPSVSAGGGATVTQTLVGTFIALIFAVVIAAVFVTAEYRRGLVRTTFAAAPGRGRVLAAKALVVGAATFAAGLAAAWIVVAFGIDVLKSHGVYVLSTPVAVQARIVVGTAVLLAGCAVLAVGLGALLRRGVTAVTASIVVVVLPYLLSVTVLPLRASDWILSVTPAAAFALQQSQPSYYQVDAVYSPADGYFPLGAWAGLLVLAVWVAAVLAAAEYRLRRRDA